MITIFRNVHPVGQGGFCSEIHGTRDCIVVYDCGTKPKSKQAEAIVNDALPEQPIDALFVSHLDSDHVSLIETLVKKRKIKKFYIPYMDAKMKALIIAITGSRILRKIFYHPERVSEGCVVYEVEPIGNPEHRMDTSEENSVRKKHVRIRSGDAIIEKVIKYWEYVPYNVYDPKRYDEFKKKCVDKGIDIGKLNENKYVCDNRKVLKNVYKSIEGGINQNSLILYSGPIASKMGYLEACCCEYVKREVGCLYTGDYDCGDVDNLICNIDKRLENVGTLQIPHHGALNSWNAKLLPERLHSAFVQFGEKNTYGHPSSTVINSIAERISLGCRRRCCREIAKVTENISSEYNQLIYVG